MLSVTVCTVRYVCLLCRVQIFVDFVSFLSMIIYVVLYSLLSYLLLNPRRGTLQTSEKSITQSEESYSTLISNPEILMLKNIISIMMLKV